jgi:hypothetical protein
MNVFETIFTFLESKLPHTTISVGGKPYLTRCYLFGKDRTWGNIYLHHFHASDQGLELHNHPWEWGYSFVLSGGYLEERINDPCQIQYVNNKIVYSHAKNCEAGRGRCEPPICFMKIERRLVKPRSFNMIRSTNFHRVDLLDEKAGAWTLFFTGPRAKSWGFIDRTTSEFRDWTTNPDAIP